MQLAAASPQQRRRSSNLPAGLGSGMDNLRAERQGNGQCGDAHGQTDPFTLSLVDQPDSDSAATADTAPPKVCTGLATQIRPDHVSSKS